VKYTIAFSALLAATLLGANGNNYEISAMGGYTIPSDGQYLDDYGTYGVEIQYNGVESPIKPELSFFYGNGDYKYDNGSTKVFRTSLNGLYSFDNKEAVTPFLKIGGGYESLSNRASGNRDGFFADVAMGLKFEMTKAVSMKVEAIKMFKHNDGTSANNLLLVAGLTFAFGDNGEQKSTFVSTTEPESVNTPMVIVEKTVEITKSTQTTTVTEPIAAITPIDSDQDGVLDSNDRCPNTTIGFRVDEYGCPLTATINDHFVFNSDHIDSTAASEIRAFVIFMKENPLYKATITGHTDSIGTPENNQIVSVRRAENVRKSLIDQGIAPERLTAVGKGESMPIMSNMLKAGRAENRRIEVDLHE
jgi:OmpA-OmpF porin, OOP family